MLEDVILSHRDYYGSYHHHKEQMAYTAATLYLAAATAVLIQGPEVWKWGSVCLVSSLLAASAVIAFVFVGWQLYQRAFAADMVLACTAISTRLLPPAGAAAPNVAPETYRGLVLPEILIDELNAIDRNRTLLSGPRAAAGVTLLAMFVWSVAAVLALQRAP